MKNLNFTRYLLLALSLLFTVSCGKFDDSALWQAINKHTEEIAALKEKCNTLNSDIESLKRIVESLQSRDYITSCMPLSDGSGYTIVFYSGNSIVIKNGIDGTDGSTPQIGIDKFTDGLYYWTLNGEWLLDKDGNMIRADGKDGEDGEDGLDGQDGITPKLKIEDGDWYISTDNGATWTNLGKASGSDGKDGKDGDSIFQSVIPGTESVTFVLADGTELSVPYYGQSQGNVTITGEYSDLTVNSVTIFGWCNQEREEGLSVVYGIEYSATDLVGAPTRVKAELKDKDNKFCCKIKTLHPETKYYYRAFSYNGVYSYGDVKAFTTVKRSCPPGAVDLGLSVCWATCNVGASKPEEYGGYYQWAGTKDVTSTSISLNQSNCPYHTGSDDSKGWTKYVPSGYSSYWSGSGSPDNKTVLDPEDDVAHVKLGEKWRMPTSAEWNDLLDNCTWTWTRQNGVNGYKVTSKRSGYTDKSIFLPAAGYRYDASLIYASSSYDGDGYGYYWSSSLFTDNPSRASILYFFSVYTNVGDDHHYVGGVYRYLGQPVRPVSD